ncbi:hypothetical protein KAW50_03500 [candidate division WOR-3 bacterium]|nr:hypothetical protein [candidate division WOR-3 bacterium]
MVKFTNEELKDYWAWVALAKKKSLEFEENYAKRQSLYFSQKNIGGGEEADFPCSEIFRRFIKDEY